MQLGPVGLGKPELNMATRLPRCGPEVVGTARSAESHDAGTSGGIWGLENGCGMMVGGADEAVRRVEPALRNEFGGHAVKKAE